MLTLPNVGGQFVLKGHDFSRANKYNRMRRALQAAEKLWISGEIEGGGPAGAKARLYFQLFAARLKSCPVTKPSKVLLISSFSAACLAPEGCATENSVSNKFPQGLKPTDSIGLVAARLKPCPFKAVELNTWLKACPFKAVELNTWLKACPFKAVELDTRLKPCLFNPYGPFVHSILSVIFIAGALLLSLPAMAQPAAKAPAHATSPAGLYTIAGTVVNSGSGEPLRHATVAALSEEDSHTVAAVESDSEGHFALERLPAAKYQLTASKRGYRTAFYDEHDLYNSAIVTGPGLETGNFTFRLVPGGVLHGLVTSEGGEPVENARVMLFMKWRLGKPEGRIGQENSVSTDDTGAYEFDNLAAGEYLLAVTAEPWYALHHSRRLSPNAARAAESEGVSDPSTALDVVYPVTYYDSTTDEASASRIVMAAGGREEANITLHPTAALHIAVDTPRKQDGSIARAELRQTVFGVVVGSESAGFLDAMQTGTTEFNGVAPGHYELAQGDPPRILEIDAAASQQVDPSLGTATVSVHGALRTTAGTPWTGEGILLLDSLDGAHRQNQVSAPCIHGTFDFQSVPPGQWRLSAESAGRQLPIVSVTVGSRARAGNLIAVQDRPLSITVSVSQGTTRLEGFARRDGKGVAGVMVVLVPAARTTSDLDALDGLFRRDQSDSDGSFSLRDVVPGQYILVAIEDGWTLDWAEPQVIARYLPAGIAVTVSDKPGKLVTLSDPVPVQIR